MPLDRFIGRTLADMGKVSGLYASVCRDPDAEELVWGEEFLVGHNVMMNKPIVVKSGEWLFPIAVWNDGIRVLSEEYDTKITEKGSFV